MNFQNLRNVENHEFYLDVTFSKAKKKVDQVKGTKTRWPSELERSKTLERARVESTQQNLSNLLNEIIEAFPSFNNLGEFYQELIELHYPIKKIQKALSSVDWAVQRNKLLASETLKKFKTAQTKDQVMEFRKSYYGRLSSVMKQINPFLEELETVRKKLKKLPAVKESLFTVAIVGFPNVGKSTLLSKLTFSMPEAKAYAFTTKQLNLGYARIMHEKIQFIDTPGSLNRPEKMNYIEKQAYLAMKLLADVILYIFDPMESYPLDDQIKLYDKVKKESGNPIVTYISKTDIAEKERLDSLKARYPDAITSPEDIMKTLEPIFLRKTE